MKRNILHLLLFLGIGLTACSSSEPEITVSEVWGRSSIKSAANAAFYMTIQNNSVEDDRLEAASSDICEAVELHETSLNEDDVMMMRQVSTIPVPAGGSVELAVGGLHIMCLDKTQTFEMGDQVNLTLTFEKYGDLVVEVEIRE